MPKTLRQLCAENDDLMTALSPYTLPTYDQVVYVDRQRGADARLGESWDKAVKSINTAQDRIYGGSNDNARGRKFLIEFRGRLTSGLAFDAEQVLDMQGVHLHGSGDASSCFVTPTTCYGSYACGLRIEQTDVEVSGIKFYNPDSTEAEHYHIYVRDKLHAKIHHNWFQGSENNGDVTNRYTSGIRVMGGEAHEINLNKFYYCYRGLRIEAGPTRYPHIHTFKENRLFDCYDGFYFPDAYCTESQFIENEISQKSMYGYAMNRGFNLSGNPGGNLFRGNVVGHATKGTAYAPGSGTNYWILNYYSGSGGTLYDGS